MTYTYPALFHVVPNGDYFVEFPDLPGCFTQGKDLAESRALASDVLGGWLELSLYDGDSLNPPSDPDTLFVNDGFVEMVTADNVDPGAVGRWRAAREAG